jgi:hypothetical protein
MVLAPKVYGDGAGNLGEPPGDVGSAVSAVQDAVGLADLGP